MGPQHHEQREAILEYLVGNVSNGKTAPKFAAGTCGSKKLIARWKTIFDILFQKDDTFEND